MSRKKRKILQSHPAHPAHPAHPVNEVKIEPPSKGHCAVSYGFKHESLPKLEKVQEAMPSQFEEISGDQMLEDHEVKYDVYEHLDTNDQLAHFFAAGAEDKPGEDKPGEDKPGEDSPRKLPPYPRATIMMNPPILTGHPVRYKTHIPHRTKFGVDSISEYKTYSPKNHMSEQLESITPSDDDDFDSVKSSLIVSRQRERTIVSLVIVDNEEKENKMSYLRCYGGTPFGGYAYDRAKDAYIISCVECCELGALAFSFSLTLKNSNWRTKIPIPDEIVEKYLTTGQKSLLAEYREKYKDAKYKIEFMQMAGCQ